MPQAENKNTAATCRVGLGWAALLLAVTTFTSTAQQAPSPTPDKGKVINGYSVHQTIELGGHITDHSGSDPMWDTLVNLSTGPRILSHSLTMRSIDNKKTPFFDDLMSSSFGYGGDPNNVTILRLSKGRAYEFNGSFRRDRQYFDYDLLANPLIPTTAVPQVPILDSPHLFNTVRRMSDVNLTVLPLSRVSFRFGYSKNTAEGPTYSTIHSAADALLNQWWRNSTDSFSGGIDFLLAPQTSLSYDQFITNYKGDTTLNLAGLNYQVLSNGQPVPASLGIDIFSTSASSCVLPGTANTIKPTCSAELAHTRYAPTRTLFPTEQLRFSTSQPRFNMNGRILYTGATGNVDHYSEYFKGFLSRTGQQQITDVGVGANSHLASLKRINVLADYGVSVQVTPTVAISDVFDFSAFRDPGSNAFSESSLYSTNSVTPTHAFDPATCGPPYTGPTCPYHSADSGVDTLLQTNHNFLGQNTKSNIFLASWAPVQKFKVSLGYRYRARTISVSTFSNSIETYTPLLALRGDCSVGSSVANTLNPDGTCTATPDPSTGDDLIQIHEQGALFGVFLHPNDKLRLNFDADAMYADNAYTRISPRQKQHYRMRTLYKPRPWASVSGSINILEGRNNVFDSHHLEHSRDYSAGASIAPSEKWSLDFNYSYDDVFSRTDICYVAGIVPPGATLNSPACDASIGPDGPPYTAATALFTPANYNAPTQFGSIAVMLNPAKKLHTSFGYRMSAVNGNESLLNPRQVPGSLQSQYQQPYANVAFDLAPQWTWKANWNYYGYGEGSPIGPTAPRSFRGNVYTLGVRYAF